MNEDIVVEEEIEYPSAELLQQACYEDYRRVIDTYDKIYEKVNITLAFCGILLLVILGSVDYTYLLALCHAETNSEALMYLALILFSVASATCAVWSVIQLLLLMRSKQILVFDSIGIRNDEIYRWDPDKAAVWVIDKYTNAVASIRNVIEEKQRSYDSAVIKVVISVLLYTVVLVIEKGV